jgi:hypothetical protein
VTNPLGPLLLEQIQHELLITDISPINGETFVVRAEGAKAAEVILLDAHVIVVIHLIYNNYRVPPGKELFGHIRANEACPTRDEYFLEREVRLDHIAAWGGGGGVIVMIVETNT